MPRPRSRTISREIQTIRASFSSIDTALRRLLPMLQHGAAAPAAPDKGQRPKLKLSAARLAALKAQGQYMGYIRSLAPRQKAQVKALRASKGIRPAIALAKKLAGA